MNAPVKPIEATLPSEPFDQALRQVNEWRGRCMDAFARAEAGVTNCLVFLSNIPGRGEQVRLPHLVGQRYEALTSVIAAGGAFELEASKVASALESVRAHDSFRTMLCHGVGDVTLSPHGRWTIVFRLVSLRSRRASSEVLALKQKEAEQLRDEVIRASKELCSQLDSMKNALRAARAR